VSSVIEYAPCLVAVKAIAIPAILSTVNNFCPFLWYYMITCIFEINYHISKSIFLPWITFPSEFLTKILEHALKVENSYMKFKKNNLSKGRPLNLANASTSATKSWCLKTFLAYHYTPV